MSKIILSHIDKYYGDNHVLKDVNLTIEGVNSVKAPSGGTAR